MLRRVTLERTEVSEELGAFIIRVTRIDELVTTFLQEPHDVTSQKTPFFLIKFHYRAGSPLRIPLTRATYGTNLCSMSHNIDECFHLQKGLSSSSPLLVLLSEASAT
jgi:hypothetical protein